VSKEVIGDAISGPGGRRLPFSKAVRAGDFVFLSGGLAFDAEGKLVGGDIEDQTRQVLNNVKATLEQAGCTLADVVKCTVWLTDPRDFADFNKVYAEFFDKEPPARSTVRADLMIDAKVELEVVAYKPI
jgi:2-iminobutanoate/2-iminopropanoate deaminase